MSESDICLNENVCGLQTASNIPLNMLLVVFVADVLEVSPVQEVRHTKPY